MDNWEEVIGGIGPNYCGARLGDTIAALPLELATSIAPNNHWLRRVWRGKTLYRLLPNGDETLITRVELVAELRKCGGYVEFDDRSYELAAGRVRSVRFAPSALKVPIRAEEQIASRLGAPQSVEQRGTLRIYNYAAWSLRVVWDHDNHALTEITVGDCGSIPGMFGPLEVLHEWFWMKNATGPRSRVVYLRRAESLFRAFGLGTAKDFERGSFLRTRRIEDFPRVASMVAGLRESEQKEFALSDFFFVLLRHWKAVYDLSRATTYNEIGGSGALLALTLARRVEKRVWSAIRDVELLLFELISPDDRRICEVDMVEKWGFPTDNLVQIMSDEW